MNANLDGHKTTLSIVIPCYNEEITLENCVKQVLQICDDEISIQIIIVDDGSTDRSLEIARALEQRYPQIAVLEHEKNQGKGAALKAGFRYAVGDYIAVQDADLEYDPQDLKRLLQPLIANKADVVFGSRFLSTGVHRVLYFWHFLGNSFLTLLSNMFTDLNLTDMETCYKVFRSDVIKNIDIKEDRFGFEPEIVAKVAHMRVRIYEMGISYYGRTYAEGKKIGFKDGFRALYCIFRYNAHCAPLPLQFLLYLMIGGLSSIVNLLVFLKLIHIDISVAKAAPAAFILAAMLNYALCILLLFRHKARWNSLSEIVIYWCVVVLVGLIDLYCTELMIMSGLSALWAKTISSAVSLSFNFLGRRYLVFPEHSSGAWKPQHIDSK